MNKKYFIIFLILLLFTSCIGNSQDAAGDQIIKPSNQKLYLSGTWKVKNRKTIITSNSDENDKYSDLDQIYIEKNLVKINDRLTLKPDFKSRFLNFSEYIKYRFTDIKEIPEELNMEGKLFTVSDGQFFYQDFFSISENSMYFIYDGLLFECERETDLVEEQILAKAKEDYKVEKESTSIENDKNNLAGVIVGIKTSKKDARGNIYNDYGSVLITSDQDGRVLASATRNLLLPRDTGFWIVGMEHFLDYDPPRDALFVYPMIGGSQANSIYQLGLYNTNSILYLGKDYIAMESKDYNSSKKSYGIYSLDKIKEGTKLNISDIAGEEGKAIFSSETAKILNNSPKESEIMEKYDTTNIGMRRVNGKWELKSNIIINDKNKLTITDYSIGVVPTIDLSTHEKLSIPWEDIRTKIPSAIDAYTSPEGDILLVQTLYELLIYKVENGVINSNSSLSLHMGETDRIVFAEWVSGPSTNSWKAVFSDHERVPVHTMIPKVRDN